MFVDINVLTFFFNLGHRMWLSTSDLNRVPTTGRLGGMPLGPGAEKSPYTLSKVVTDFDRCLGARMEKIRRFVDNVHFKRTVRSFSSYHVARRTRVEMWPLWASETFQIFLRPFCSQARTLSGVNASSHFCRHLFSLSQQGPKPANEITSLTSIRLTLLLAQHQLLLTH